MYDNVLHDVLIEHIEDDDTFINDVMKEMKRKILEALDNIDLTDVLENEVEDLVHYICYERVETSEELGDYILNNIKDKLDIRFKSNEEVQDENER